ncbi:1,4-dihydroxy-2-naphthoate polyprenyltransferase [Minicystis rosea]|nr:1,4-dihydroxy-2-naphthoate polyprenyltransferase [Minicystis rosea]
MLERIDIADTNTGAREPPPRSRERPGKLAAFVRLGRPKFLVYSLLLYGLGAAVLVHEGRALDLGRFFQGLAFVWCAHLMTHYCNEYFDLAADAENTSPTRWTGGSRVLVEGHLPPVVSLGTAFVLLFGALALTLAMPVAAARWLAFLVLSLAWFYTAPPLQLNYRGFGEITVATVLSLSVPLLAYALQEGRLTASPVLLGAILPIFVVQVARMVVMNLSDCEGDARAGKRTLAVVLGPRRATKAVALGQVIAYGTLFVLVVMGTLPLAVGVPMLLTLPIAVWQVRRIGRGAIRNPRDANSVVFWASTHVALLAIAATFGLLAQTSLTAPPSRLDASLALCTAILVFVGALVARQIHRNGCAARRHATVG